MNKEITWSINVIIFGLKNDDIFTKLEEKNLLFGCHKYCADNYDKICNYYKGEHNWISLEENNDFKDIGPLKCFKKDIFLVNERTIKCLTMTPHYFEFLSDYFGNESWGIYPQNATNETSNSVMKKFSKEVDDYYGYRESIAKLIIAYRESDKGERFIYS